MNVTENGVQRIAETAIDGKYLVVEVSGNSAVLMVSERDYTVLIIAAASAAAAAVVIILIIIIRKKNKNSPQNSAPKDKNEENALV